nr:MAG TPA: YopX protein [Caudoviricetes sp.]
MEDRCLFKAKICNGEWVAGFLHCKNDKWYISNKAGSPFAFEVRPDTICQCTGLKDKNGKLIWENDIMKYQWDGKTRIDVVKYEPPLFTYSKAVRWDLGADEVIGNIFDNPELIKEI